MLDIRFIYYIFMKKFVSFLLILGYLSAYSYPIWAAVHWSIKKVAVEGRILRTMNMYWLCAPIICVYIVPVSDIVGHHCKYYLYDIKQN